MDNVAHALCEEIQGAQLAYTQSDEISVLVHGYKKLNSEPWFANELQKMVSSSAALASVVISHSNTKTKWNQFATFDSRAFVIPENDVCNYFLWRQQDASRNSVQMAARSVYSHNECENKNGSELQEMLHQKGINWNDYPTKYRRGGCVVKKTYGWGLDEEIPIFSQDRFYIERLLEHE